MTSRYFLSDIRYIQDLYKNYDTCGKEIRY